MTRSVDELKAMLQEEGRLVTPDLRRRRAVVGRVRRRRTAKAALSSVAVAAVLVASYAGIAATVDRPERPAETRIAGHDGYAFEWQRGDYPVLATGTYEGEAWTLEVVGDPDAAHPEDTESENPEILFTIEGGEIEGGAFETSASADVLPEPFHSRLDEAELLMGAVSVEADRVTAELGDGRYYDAAIVDVAEGPLDGTSYYLAFLPEGAAGQVLARDASDTPIGRVALEAVPVLDLEYSTGCRPSARADGPPSEFRFESEPGTYPVLAQGTFGSSYWTLEMVEDPDAAHPEDTESENPEVLFTIEGGEIEGGAFETSGDWSVVEASIQFRLDDGTEVVLGMVAADVESVTVETDAGRSFPAEIADGAEGPLPGTDYFLAFLPSNTEGDVVTRDANGTVAGRTKLPGDPGPRCPAYEAAP